jgi:hypothetical protein
MFNPQFQLYPRLINCWFFDSSFNKIAGFFEVFEITAGFITAGSLILVQKNWNCWFWFSDNENM